MTQRKLTVQKQKGVDTPEPGKSKEVKGKAKDLSSSQKEDDTFMETPVGKARRKGDEVSDNGGAGEEFAAADEDAGDNKEQGALQDDTAKQKPDIQTMDKQEGKLPDVPLDTEKSPELPDAKKCCKSRR